MIVGRVAAVVAGIASVAWVLDAAVRNFLLPRATWVLMTRWLASWGPGGLLGRAARRAPDYQTKDRLVAARPVLTLLTFQVAWLTLVYFGFALIYWGSGAHVHQALDQSGSALFTLGFAIPRDAVPQAWSTPRPSSASRCWPSSSRTCPPSTPRSSGGSSWCRSWWSAPGPRPRRACSWTPSAPSRFGPR